MSKIKWVMLVFIGILIFSYLMGIAGVGNLNADDLKDATYIDIDGESLRYLEKGHGRDMLLIHGTPGSIEDMQPLIDSLAKDNHVIAYDRPGHGYSSANDIPRNLEHNTRMAEKLIEFFQMDSVIVFGHSYGGIVAMNIAINGNDRVEKVYVLGSPLFTFNCPLIYKLFRIPILKTSLSWMVSGLYSKSKIKNELPSRFAKHSKIPNEKFIKTRQDLWSQPKVILSKSIETALIEKDVLQIIDKYNSLQENVTVIIGEEDVPYYISDLKENLPIKNLEAKFYPATGHFIQMESIDQLLLDVRSNDKRY